MPLNGRANLRLSLSPAQLDDFLKFVDNQANRPALWLRPGKRLQPIQRFNQQRKNPGFAPNAETASESLPEAV